MAAKHVLEAATNGIAPIEILFVSVDRTGTAWPCAAIVNESCFVIHADAAAGRVNQPVIERERWYKNHCRSTHACRSCRTGRTPDQQSGHRDSTVSFGSGKRRHHCV